MKFLLFAVVLLDLGVVGWLFYHRRSDIRYPIVPKWSHFKAGDRIFDGDRWTGEDDAA